MEFLHPAMWHDHDINFAKWLHPAMWHVALRSWQWIHQVAVGLPCNVKRGSGMTCHSIRQVAAPCNVAGGSGITCHLIRPNDCHFCILASRSKMADLSNGFFEKPVYDFLQVVIETIALNCLVFKKIAFLYFGDRQTDRRTDGQARCMKPLLLSRAAAE